MNKYMYKYMNQRMSDNLVWLSQLRCVLFNFFLKSTMQYFLFWIEEIFFGNAKGENTGLSHKTYWKLQYRNPRLVYLYVG